MKVVPVSELKHPTHRPLRAYPQEGSLARTVYDRLYASRGRPVVITDILRGRSSKRAIADLRDYYGCDIRRAGYGFMMLAGEWFGLHYVDYVNEAIDAAVRDGEAA